MSIVYFGTPEFAVPPLEALIDGGERVLAVVTQGDKRRSRGGAPSPSPVKERALLLGIPVLTPRSVKDEGFIAALHALAPEFMVVVAYGKILPRAVLEIPRIAPINLHASLLPRYRGAAPIARAVAACERETGLCTMLMNEGMDEGDVLVVERFPILERDTAGSLSARLSKAGGPLILRTLRGMREGTVTPMPQGGEPSYAPMLTKEDGRVDWLLSARGIECIVRGMQPWPGAFAEIDGLRVRLLSARARPGSAQPGIVAAGAADALTVGTGEGLLEITELQPPGKWPMKAGDFLRGRSIPVGARLG